MRPVWREERATASERIPCAASGTGDNSDVRSRRFAFAAGFAVLVALTPTLAGCGLLFPSGNDVARAAAESAADQIGSHTDNTSTVTLLEMVAVWVPEGSIAAGEGSATAEPLAWSGEIGRDSEATIDVRIHATVQADQTIGGHGPGEATVCYRLVWPLYDEAKRTEISCPDTPAPPRPTPEPRPELTENDRAEVESILQANDDLADIEDALHAAFPEDYMQIQTELWNGETVVAVGIPAERECILIVRDQAGALSYPSYRQISLEPGETGCAPDLYTNPPF